MKVPKDVMEKARVAIHSWRDVDWSLQGFGMLSHYLTEDKEWRLHVWDDHYRVADVTMIHNHPWNFDSMVLSGSLVNHRYRVIYDLWGRFGKPTHWETRILASEDARADGISKAVILVPRSTEFYVAGEPRSEYHLDWDEVHHTDALNGTITITFHDFVNLDYSDDAFSYRAHDKEWVSSSPRSATPGEVSDVFRCAVNRMLLYGGPFVS